MKEQSQPLTKTFHQMLTQIRAEQGYLIDLAADYSHTFRLKLKADGTPIDADTALISQTITDVVIKSEQPVITRNAMTDRRFAADRSVMRLRIRSVICVPLWHEGRIVSLIYVEHRAKRGQFNHNQVPLLEALGEPRAQQAEAQSPEPLPAEKEALVQAAPSQEEKSEQAKSPHSRYILHEQLGRGGMGMVHRATDRLTGEIVALKQVYLSQEKRAFLSSMVTATQRNFRFALAQEFQIVAGMRHPHIISVLDYGFGPDQQPYFTMTYLPETQTFLDAGKGLDEAGKLDLLRQLLQALTYLHRRGVIHRDLKPSNVLVVEQRVQVLDFGLSISQETTLTSAGGTLLYMAPELFDSQAASLASDLYAVGVMAYQLFTGQHPFDITSYKFLDQVKNKAPNLAALGLDDALATVIDTLLAKNPNDRYQSAKASLMAINMALGETDLAESAAIRESYLQAATFVGRDVEMAQLQAALAAAKEGRGAMWLIGGESGVGKSRLINELRTRALVEGFQVLRGQAIAEGGSPYQVWRNLVEALALNTDLNDLEAGVLQTIAPRLGPILNRVIPEPPQLEGGASQQRLIFTLSTLLQRQRQPTLLLLEDLHWAKESLEPLKQIIPRLNSQPMLIIGSYRNDEQPHLPEQFGGQLRALNLARLNDEAIGQLASAMLGEVGYQPEVVAQLFAETEGNVFFLVEVLRAWAEEAGGLLQVKQTNLPKQILTGGIQAIIRRRLNKVPSVYQPLLQLAAVAGRQLDLSILTVLKEEVALSAWLLACREAMVLNIQENQWQFEHDKLREVLLEELTAAEKKQHHQQVAEALESVYPERDDLAATLADHWQAAGNRNKEIPYRITNSEQLLWSGGYDEAKQHIQALLTNDENSLTDAVKLHLFKILSDCCREKYDYEAAITWAQKGVTLSRQLGHNKATMDHLINLGWAMWRQIIVSPDDNSAVWDEAKSHFKEAAILAESLQDVAALAHALHNQSIVAHYRDHNQEQAVALNKRAIALFKKANDLSGLVMSINDLGVLYHYRGDYSQAKACLEESLSLAQQIGNPSTIPFSLAPLFDFALLDGDWLQAKKYSNELLQCITSPQHVFYNEAFLYAGIIAFYYQNYEQTITYCKQGLLGTEDKGGRIWLQSCLVGAAALMQNDRVNLTKALLKNSENRLHITQAKYLEYLWLLYAGKSLLENKIEQGAAWLGFYNTQKTITAKAKNERHVHIADVAEKIQAKFQEQLESPQAKAAFLAGAKVSLDVVLDHVKELEVTDEESLHTLLRLLHPNETLPQNTDAEVI